MEEISNKTLAALVVLAIVVSIGSTVILVNRVKLGGITGGATGIAKVNVTSMAAISLPVNVVDFGNVYQNASDNTSDNSPGPLTVQNDGTVNVNVSINSSASGLFSGTGGGANSASFQFKVDNSTEANSFNYGASVTSWTNIPSASTMAIMQLKPNDVSDLAEVDLLINVPADESIGPKQETLTFTAVQS